MKVVLSTLSISPHQTAVFGPFARLADFTYCYHDTGHDEQRAACGWTDKTDFSAVFVPGRTTPELEETPLLLENMRDLDLIERRLKKGLKTIYVSERWFKPFAVGGCLRSLKGLRGLAGVNLPGFLRLLFPRYLRMAWRVAKFFKDPNFWYLPQGIWAARDLARVRRLFTGDLRCLFRAPKLDFEPAPCGRIAGEPRMRLWGYYVSPSSIPPPAPSASRKTLRVLWVGRMIGLKRVETIVKAVKLVSRDEGVGIRVTLVGEGDERARLEKMAAGLPVTFLGYQKADRIRELMREHDAYVLSSDGAEGWGAVVNEALEEGMCVYGTREAGASATMLPAENLYAAGKARELAELLRRPVKYGSIGAWSAERAARALAEFLEKDVLHDFCR